MSYTISGKASTYYGTSGAWHLLGSSNWAGLIASGSVDVTRADSNTKEIKIKGTCYSKLKNDSTTYTASYGYHIKVGIFSGGELKDNNHNGDNYNKYLSGATLLKDLGWTTTYGSDCKMELDDNTVKFDFTDNDATIYIAYYCGQEEGSSYDGCTTGYSGTSGRGVSDWVVVCEISANDFPYKPYTTPSEYWCSFPSIVRDDLASSMSYGIKVDSNTVIDWADCEIYPSSSYWSYGKWNDIAQWVKDSRKKTQRFLWHEGASGRTQSSGSVSVTPSVGDGAEYRIAIHFSDNHYEWLSGDDKKFKTYTKPTVSSVTISNYTFSPQNNQSISWAGNSPKWTSNNQEVAFESWGKIGDSWVTELAKDSSSFTLSDAILKKYFSDNDRSVAKMTDKIITIYRYNTKATVGNNWYEGHLDRKFSVQYQPTKKPNQFTKTYDGNSVSGTIYVQDIPKINLTWSYPSSEIASGVVNGYKIRIYTDSNCTQIYKTLSDTTSVTKQIDTKSDLKRGVTNYVKITPYYTKPNGTGQIEGTQSFTSALCKPLSRLNTPVISYPISNTTWHNKDFRVLFQLPVDDDLNTLISQGVIGNQESYRYADIQLKITYSNGTITTISHSSNKTIFNLNNLTYQGKVGIYPNKLNLSDSSNYKLSIRVKKNYYDTSDIAWSKWSSEVILNKSSVVEQTLLQNQVIKIEEYNYLRNASVRLNAVYPISNINNKNVSRSQGDIIKYEDYKGIYDTIKQLQTNINNYCSVYENDIRLNQDITDLTTNPPKQEIITSNKTETNGRNYINIIISDINKLY